MKNSALKTNLVKILLFINTISSIGIPCLGNYIDLISIYYFFISISSFFIIIFIRKVMNIGGFFKYICFYYLILLFSTFFSHGDIYLLICETIITLTTILLWNSFDKTEYYDYLPILTLALEILTYLNLAIILFSPEGLYNQGYIRKYFLFGHVNITFRYLLPGCCFNMIRSFMYNNKIDKRCILYFIAVALTLALTWPATAIVGFVVFFISYLLMTKFNKLCNVLNPLNSMICSAILSFVIIFNKLPSFLVKFLSNVLHKDVTFSGRLKIWNTAIQYIKKNWMFGYGRLSIVDRNTYFKATSAHNEFLILLFEGGIILLLLVIILFAILYKKMKKCNNKIIINVLLSTILSYAFMWITEPFSYSGTLLMFLVWLFAYNSKFLFQQ